MQYKNFILDQFQVDAISSIEKNNSVVVSAATGTGKTLIADYIINKFFPLGKKIVYTAPIKALSNQKFKDFKREYGVEKVGLMTGDVVINSNAQLLIMTTEIYRNMILAKDAEIKDVSYVVFDEIHFMSDIERGTVWEESIIFSPEHIRFLCLSATIPNAKEFASWIQEIKKHNVDVVEYHKRAVPLQHFIYDSVMGVCSIKDLKSTINIPEYHYGKKQKKQPIDPKTHVSLVKEIRDKLPAIFFSFGRKDCERKGFELSQRFDFSTPEQKSRIISISREKLPKEVLNLSSVRNLRQILPKGIAYHHAGLLPVLKELVEDLFEKGLIKVLYATETFAVGVNMPAKSVCFASLEKYDGYTFRYLFSKEYFQLAGRAGRRGIDKIGYVYAIVDRNFDDIERIERFTSKDVDPIISQFRVTYNTVLHLVNAHTREEIEKILTSNFDYFLRKKEKTIRIIPTFYNRVNALEKMGYLNTTNFRKNDYSRPVGELTEKGFFTLHIYFEELITAEIFSTKLYEELTANELLVVIASIIYEFKHQDFFDIGKTKNFYEFLMKKLSKNEYVIKNINRNNVRKMIKIVTSWATGCYFNDILQMTDYQEGDIIRLFRRMIDLMRQIRRATQDDLLKQKIEHAISGIDRDLVKAEF